MRIYGDNDAGAEFDGQAAAYALARRFAKEAHRYAPAGVDVKVFIPRHEGTDWADVFVSIHGQAAA